MSAAKVIQVATPTGPKSVKAITTKHLAVHESLCGEHWALSHRPTGCRMGFFTKRAEAQRAAKALERNNAADLAVLAGSEFAVGARPKFRGEQAVAIKRLRKAINALGRIEAQP